MLTYQFRQCLFTYSTSSITIIPLIKELTSLSCRIKNGESISATIAAIYLFPIENYWREYFLIEDCASTVGAVKVHSNAHFNHSDILINQRSIVLPDISVIDLLPVSYMTAYFTT